MGWVTRQQMAMDAGVGLGNRKLQTVGGNSKWQREVPQTQKDKCLMLSLTVHDRTEILDMYDEI